jgi:hypothetical protein
VNTKTATMAILSGATGYGIINKNTGVGVALTLANWKYKFVAQRGW